VQYALTEECGIKAELSDPHVWGRDRVCLEHVYTRNYTDYHI
jgi:hypothetical protein